MGLVVQLGCGARAVCIATRSSQAAESSQPTFITLHMNRLLETFALRYNARGFVAGISCALLLVGCAVPAPKSHLASPLSERNAVAAIATPNVRTSAESTNRLLNGGFENLAPNGRTPVGWSLAQHAGDFAYRMEPDSSNFVEGKRSFKISRYAEQAYGIVQQPILLNDTKKPTGAIFSAQLRSLDATEEGWLLTANVSFPNRPHEQVRSKALTGTRPWTKVDLFIPLAPDAIDIKVGAMLLGGGTGWIDDASVILIY